jgi:(p)ppGpp synthase/HD superfamily hydrolase
VTVLRPPRHRLVEHSLAQARCWCAGQVIDDRPALVHAVRVAVTLGEHVPDPDPELIAAALLHDSPEFAPVEVDLDAVLGQHYGGEVVRIVRALQAEHHALDTNNPITIADDLPVLLASTSDKIVALASLTRRAEKSGDPVGFFAARPALLALLPRFQTFRDAGIGRVPASMTRQLGAVLDTLSAAARCTA